MWYVLLAVLSLLALLIAVLALALWTKTTIIVRFREGQGSAEIICLGLHFSIPPAKPRAEKTPPREQKAEPAGVLQAFKQRLQADYRSIRPKEGGIDLDALRESAGYYLSLLQSGKEVLGCFLRHMRRRVSVSLRADLTFGTGDPADTGILCGWIWNSVGIFYPPLARYFRFAFPALTITPDFYQKRYEIDAEGIIQVRAAHIINALAITAFTNMQLITKLRRPPSR